MRILFILIVFSLCSCNTNENFKKEINLSEALSIYVKSNCVKYSRDTLKQYFSDNIVNEIRQKYIPYEEFNRFQQFVEMDSPSIKIINILNKDNNVYEVNVLYGEVLFNYKVITDNELIINIKELNNNVL